MFHLVDAAWVVRLIERSANGVLPVATRISQTSIRPNVKNVDERSVRMRIIVKPIQLFFFARS
jgi:hypothetical protein